MNARIRQERRLEVSQRRVPPVCPQRVYFPANGAGQVNELETTRPIELCVEATDADGQTVEWLSDAWWMRVQSVLHACSVTVVIMPTPGALFDAVVVHQLEMLRRIAHHWRVIGYASAEMIDQQKDLDRWVNSPYDEIRFCEDDVATLNGRAQLVHGLIEEAGKRPLMDGFHQSRIRIVRSASLPSAQPAA